MEITFEKEYLRQLYELGKTSDKKHRFQPQVISRYQLRIKFLEQARNIEDLYPLHSFHYEVLKGDKAGISSIRVNDQYRIGFTVQQIASESVVNICNILELSNHYKRLFKNKSEFWVVHVEGILSCRRGSIAGDVTEPKGKSHRQERVRRHFLSSFSVK